MYSNKTRQLPNKLPPLQAYIVGGAVRDRLLGREVADRDWVVIGATPEEMLARGFRPVGKDFPVFLHPKSREEYALARTERKVARGYHGFSFHAAPEVTLAQDLARRDLTINAMALDADGSIIDPYHGQADLRAGILRHVSPAFAEDPVRILRTARFAARFGFSLAPETLQLTREMVSNGEVDTLVAERVWQEMAKALMERQPSGFFLTLRLSGALAHILPELDPLFGTSAPTALTPALTRDGAHRLDALDYAAGQNTELAVRFAVLMLNLDAGKEVGTEVSVNTLLALCARLRVPAECRDLAKNAILYRESIHAAAQLDAHQVLRLFKACDALRRPQRFLQLLRVASADLHGRPWQAHAPYPQEPRLAQLLQTTLTLDAGAIAAQCDHGDQIATAIDLARRALIADAMRQEMP